jgi:hypothetical protein
MTAWGWVTLLSEIFTLLKGPSESKLSTRRELRRFADFLRREVDVVTATVLVVLLQVLSILPLTTLHAQLVVNYAYAASLRTVTTRTTLMMSAFAANISQTPKRLLLYLWSSHVWLRFVSSLRYCIARLTKRRGTADGGAALLSVFSPTIDAESLPARLNMVGEFTLEPSGRSSRHLCV